jgi:hypothetical protein
VIWCVVMWCDGMCCALVCGGVMGVGVGCVVSPVHIGLHACILGCVVFRLI